LKLGCTVWPVCWNPPYEDAIRRISKLGFKGIELIAWSRKVLDEYYTQNKIREIKELIDSLGLELTEFISTPKGMASLNREEQKAALSHFERLVEVASEFETKIVNTVSPWPFHGVEPPNIKRRPLLQTFLMPENLPYNADFDEIWMSYVDLMKRFCEVVEDAGLRYAIEPHPWRIISNADAMLRLIEHVGSKVLGMNFDPSHLFPMGETPAIAILKLKDRVFHTHISDNDASSNVHWRPGKGKIDWVSVLKALKSVGYDYVLSVELEDAPGASKPGVENASPAYDSELTKAIAFLKETAAEAKVRIE